MPSGINREKGANLVAFYADSDLLPDDFAPLAAQLLYTIATLSEHHQTLIVDDGGTLRGKGIDIDGVVQTIPLIPREGKTGAILLGLTESLIRFPDAKFIVQADCDGDPHPSAATAMVCMLEKYHISENQPAMILGERQHALEEMGHMDEHRAKMFRLQKKLCEMLDYPQLGDPTTGLRVYNRKLAEIFVQNIKGEGFGLDVEQLIIARLAGAVVLPYQVARAHKRGDSTSVDKFSQSQQSVMLHADELRQAGLGDVVDFFGQRELLPALVQAGLYLSERGEELVVSGKDYN